MPTPIFGTMLDTHHHPIRKDPAISDPLPPQAPAAVRAPFGAGQFTPRLLVYFAIVTMIWGSTWLVITTQLGSVPASWSVAWRFLAGGTVMMAVCLLTGKSLRMDRRGHLFAIGIAVM